MHEDDHLEAEYEDRYIDESEYYDYEPDPYAGTYSED